MQILTWGKFVLNFYEASYDNYFFYKYISKLSKILDKKNDKKKRLF